MLAACGSPSRSTAPAPAPVVPPAPAAPARPESASVYVYLDFDFDFDFDDSRLERAGLSVNLSVIERYRRYVTDVRAASARLEGHAEERGSGVAAVGYGDERSRAPGSDEALWAQKQRAMPPIKR